MQAICSISFLECKNIISHERYKSCNNTLSNYIAIGLLCRIWMSFLLHKPLRLCRPPSSVHGRPSWATRQHVSNNSTSKNQRWYMADHCRLALPCITKTKSPIIWFVFHVKMNYNKIKQTIEGKGSAKSRHTKISKIHNYTFMEFWTMMTLLRKTISATRKLSLTEAFMNTSFCYIVSKISENRFKIMWVRDDYIRMRLINFMRSVLNAYHVDLTKNMNATRLSCKPTITIFRKKLRGTIYNFRDGLTKEYEPQPVSNRATNIQN
jgi:hypothetical protein